MTKFVASIILGLALGMVSFMIGCNVDTSFLIIGIIIAGGIAGSEL